MFNTYYTNFQPYFIVQTSSTAFTPSLFQENTPFIFPQFISINPYQNHTQQLNNATAQESLPSQPILTSNQAQGKNIVRLGVEVSRNKNLIKENIIKKPANRPATYLTEKKYYLAQVLQEESNSNRKLRQRNLKKIHQKQAEKSALQNQHSLDMGEKNNLAKDDSGSVYLFQWSQKRKTDQRSTVDLGKQMKSYNSLFREESQKNEL